MESMIPLVSVLDFETLSTEHNAALLSIGAVIRDFNNGTQVDTFYANIIPQSSIDVGLHVSTTGNFDNPVVTCVTENNTIARF